MTAKRIPAISPALAARACALRDAGWPVDRIASRLRTGHPTISACLRALGYDLSNKRNAGIPRRPDVVVKTCRGPCGDDNLPLSEFYKNRASSDDHHHTCSMCMRAYQKVEYGKRVKERTEERKAIVNRQQLFANGRQPRSRAREKADWEGIYTEETIASYEAQLAPPPLFFRDGRRIDEPKPRRWAL